MSGKRTMIGFWLVLILSLSMTACSNLENPVIELQSTLSPDSTVESEGDHPIALTESGVEGNVWIGPTCPVIFVGTECPDRPYMAELTITDIEGNVVVKSKSNADGSFRIPLSPGSYILVPERTNPKTPPLAQPIPFDVEPDSYTHLEIVYDSGIR